MQCSTGFVPACAPATATSVPTELVAPPLVAMNLKPANGVDPAAWDGADEVVSAALCSHSVQQRFSVAGGVTRRTRVTSALSTNTAASAAPATRIEPAM